MTRLSRAALVVAITSWLLLAAFSLASTVMYGRDLASAILGVLGVLIGAGAAYCLGRAVDGRGRRVGFRWAGRALALAGATVAIVFPTVLYGEVVMLAQQGRAPTYDIEAAIWHEFRIMPLTVVPALVALRWGRIGGLLFLLVAAYSLADGVYGFAGVNYYPERQSDPVSLLLANLPGVLTAALLLIGSERWRDDGEIQHLPDTGRAGLPIPQ